MITYLTMLSMLAFAQYPHNARLGAETGLIFYCIFFIDGYAV